MGEIPDLNGHKITVFEIDVPDGMTAAEYVARAKLRSVRAAAKPRRKQLLDKRRLLIEGAKLMGGAPIQIFPKPGKRPKPQLTPPAPRPFNNR